MRIIGAVLEESGRSGPFSATRPLTVDELDLADPGPTELLIRIEAAGICHSDLSVVDGNRPRPTPMLLGHEAAGIVERVGGAVHDVAEGDRVVLTFLPITSVRRRSRTTRWWTGGRSCRCPRPSLPRSPRCSAARC